METRLQPNQAGSVGTPTVLSVLFKDANTGTEIRVGDHHCPICLHYEFMNLIITTTAKVQSTGSATR